jgi:hypothetical protein
MNMQAQLGLNMHNSCNANVYSVSKLILTGLQCLKIHDSESKFLLGIDFPEYSLKFCYSNSINL